MSNDGSTVGHDADVSGLPTSDVTELREGDRRVWRRHPVDVARLVARAAVLLVVLTLTAAYPTALTNVSADLVRLFARLPDSIRYVLVGLAQLTIVLVAVAIVVWLLRQRTRLEAMLVVGSAVAGGLFMLLLTDWLQRAAPPADITDLPSGSFVPSDVPSIAFLAALASGAAAASPMMSVFWRRVAWSGVWLAAAVRLLSATEAPVGVAVTIALGGTMGALALVVFGTPERRPGSTTLRAVLSAGGLDVARLADEASSTGVRSYRATMNGADIEVQYLDRDDRDVEMMARLWRVTRIRDVEEQRLSTNPRTRSAEQAVVSTMAAEAGVRVPKVLGVVPAPRDSAVVVIEAPTGPALSDLVPEDVSERTLDDLWEQLGLLHDARIAHRSLTADHLVVGRDGAELAALQDALVASTEESRAVDRADLLITTATVVGAERALDAAVRSTSRERLEAALPFVQIPALPTATQRVVKQKQHKGLVDEVRTGLQDRLGVDEVELVELQRISIAKVVTWIGFAVLAFFLLTLITSWPEIRQAMSGVDWVWVVPVFLATIFGTFGGAMSLSGSVVRPVALGEATVIMFGQSFLNRFTPMNAGGMAMRIRYLQKGGTDPIVATAAIGLTSAASGVMQVLFIAFFFLWSSSDPTGGITGGSSGGGPDGSLIAVFVIAILVAAVVIVVTPSWRRWVAQFVRSTIAKIRNDFGELARMPTKLALLFGGAAIGKLSTIVAFVAACRAFDIDLAFAELGALYLAATTVASAVPTPGGVGAVEAALVFVLTNAGVDEAVAWAAVLLFRLVNYWFPTIPGYLALKISERRELV